MLRRVLGLDVGSHAVKAVELRQSLRSVEIVQMRTLPLDVPGPALGEELRDFVTAHGLPTDHVACALPGDRVSSRRLSFPFRDRRRIDQAVPFAVEGEVPFDLDEFFLDWEIVGGDRSHADVVVTLAPRSEVALLLKTLAEAGIEPRVVEAEGLSLANLGAVFDLPGPRLLVDLGHRKTTICLVLDGRPAATRTIPIAGQALTQAIAKERHLAEGEAERVKLESGVFAHGLDAGGSEVHALLDRLARELVRTLGSLETILARRGARIDEVTLLGGTSRLHRLPDYLAQRTGLGVAVLPPPPEPYRAPVLAAGDPLLFAPALALALRGTTQARTRMNFRQDEFARRVNFRRLGRELRWSGILAATVGVLALASAAVHISREGRRAERVEANVATPLPGGLPGPARADGRGGGAARGGALRPGTGRPARRVRGQLLRPRPARGGVDPRAPGPRRRLRRVQRGPPDRAHPRLHRELRERGSPAGGARALRALRADRRERDPERLAPRRRHGQDLQPDDPARRREGEPVREWWGRLRAVLDQLSPRERWLVGAVGGLFAVLLLLLAVVSPLRAALERGRERAAAAEQQLTVALALRRELDEVQGRLAHVEQRIREGPRGNLFTTLESLARESAVKVDSMQPQTVPGDAAYRETKVEVKLEGVSLAQLSNYLHRIESAPQLLSVKSLRIRTRSDKPDLLDVTFTVSSFEPV